MEHLRALRADLTLDELAQAAASGPTVLHRRGQPEFVVMSAGECRRLKAAAGETVRVRKAP